MTSLAVRMPLPTLAAFCRKLKKSSCLSQRALMSLNLDFICETMSEPTSASLASAVASPLAPKVAMLKASMPTLTTWLIVVVAHTVEVVAAPIPHSTQPFGGPAQHTGPTPVYPDWQGVQQRPPCCWRDGLQIMGLGSPMMMVLAQEMSNWALGWKPQLLQLKGFGLQMQHPKAQKPALHLGQTIAPFCSQFPLPQSAQHRANIPSLLRPSPNFHGQPAPLPYSTSLQKRPWSSKPAGQFWWQSKPNLVYPAGHLVQHSRPIFSREEEHLSRGVPAPRVQEFFQQKVAWLLKICCCVATSRSRIKAILHIGLNFIISLLNITNLQTEESQITHRQMPNTHQTTRPALLSPFPPRHSLIFAITRSYVADQNQSIFVPSRQCFSFWGQSQRRKLAMKFGQIRDEWMFAMISAIWVEQNRWIFVNKAINSINKPFE